MKPVFFTEPSDFHEWLEKNHETEEILWVGYYKVSTGKPSMKWAESVEVALCFGWIDGLRKSIDEESYKIRFTPRRPGSHWSDKNIKTIKKLKEAGRMYPAGLKAFEQLDEENARKASYERDTGELNKKYIEKIRANKKAWDFFEDLAPSYTNASIHWVMSAKREETRLRRLDQLIESSENGKKIPQLRYGERSD